MLNSLIFGIAFLSLAAGFVVFRALRWPLIASTFSVILFSPAQASVLVPGAGLVVHLWAFALYGIVALVFYFLFIRPALRSIAATRVFLDSVDNATKPFWSRVGWALKGMWSMIMMGFSAFIGALPDLVDKAGSLQWNGVVDAVWAARIVFIFSLVGMALHANALKAAAAATPAPTAQ
jgi:hypothetical protein